MSLTHERGELIHPAVRTGEEYLSINSQNKIKDFKVM